MTIQLSDYVSDGNTYNVIKQATNPTPSNDGFMVGSFWVNTLTNSVWMCTDNTPSNAIWSSIDLEVWTNTTTSVSASANDHHVVSGGITVTLPASPTFGDMVQVVPGDDWSTTNSTVSGNGEKINGDTEVFTLDTNIGVTFVYTGSTWGWGVGQ